MAKAMAHEHRYRFSHLAPFSQPSVVLQQSQISPAGQEISITRACLDAVLGDTVVGQNMCSAALNRVPCSTVQIIRSLHYFAYPVVLQHARQSHLSFSRTL